jgi:hypothetical protein
MSALQGCKRGVDTVIALAQEGSFLHLSGQDYLHIPSDNSPRQPLRFVSIDPTGSKTQSESQPPGPFAGIYKPKINLYRSSMFLYGQQQGSTTEAGSWTSADVFALSGLSTRQVLIWCLAVGCGFLNEVYGAGEKPSDGET